MPHETKGLQYQTVLLGKARPVSYEDMGTWAHKPQKDAKTPLATDAMI